MKINQLKAQIQACGEAAVKLHDLEQLLEDEPQEQENVHMMRLNLEAKMRKWDQEFDWLVNEAGQ